MLRVRVVFGRSERRLAKGRNYRAFVEGNPSNTGFYPDCFDSLPKRKENVTIAWGLLTASLL
jgi:hypothetical protein